MITFAPIALFVYKRPEHTKKTLSALLECPELSQSPLFIFCDGAKKETDINTVEETREVVRSMVGDTATIIENQENKGLANSIIGGVTRLVNEYSKVIVLEDDLVVNKKFLEYMNKTLDFYANHDRVMQISGYMFPVRQLARQNEALFLPFIYSWGWATWKRAWDKFDAQALGWEILEKNADMRHRFNLDNNYDFFTMLNLQMAGEIDSWAIRWYWSVFNNNGYVVYPPNTYVKNIGFDGSGTHGSWYANLRLGKQPITDTTEMISLPESIEIAEEKYNYVKNYMRTLQPKWIKLLKKFINAELVSRIRTWLQTIKKKKVIFFN